MRVYNENNMQIIEITDYTSVQDYSDFSNKENLKDIAFNIIWNTERQCINKGMIFVFRNMDKLYNILVDEGVTIINERTPIEDIIEERVLRVDAPKQDYTYSLLKHNDIKSTFYTGSIAKNNALSIDPLIPASEALEEVTRILTDLQGVDGIENVISVDNITSIVIDDLKNRVEPTI